MIPVLYSASATDFTTNGIGRLTDCISCKVTEERNGAFELEMEIATTSPFFSSLQVGSLIGAVPYKNGTRQAFEVYRISKPINQIVTVNAAHLSYRASYIPVTPFTAKGITNALAGLTTNALETQPFTLTSDSTNTDSTLDIVSPRSLRACLGGSEGSLLDTFGGEYLWDNWTISLLTSRGSDNGVYLRYGKNITDLTHVEDIEDMVTGVLPYWVSSDGTEVFYGTVQYSPNASLYATHRTVCLDLSGEFQTAPSLAQLDSAGQEYITAATVGVPDENITLSFIDLSQTGEAAVLENINLCDTVHVVYSPLNITFEAKVVKTVWDTLAERYDLIEIGTPKSTLAQTLRDNIGEYVAITTGKKLISIVQTIDTEIGEVVSAVSSVQEDIDEIDGQIITIGQTVNSTVERQTDDEIAWAATQTQVNALTGDVEEIGTYMNLNTDGLHISQGDEQNYVLITDEGMTIYVSGTPSAYATVEGFNASTFITGEWHIQPTNGNDSLNFFRKGS